MRGVIKGLVREWKLGGGKNGKGVRGTSGRDE